MKQKMNNRGFTLIELMLVVIILGILVTLVVPRLVGRSEQARREAARADIEANLSVALDMYELDNGVFPATDQGLEALWKKPESSPVPRNWKGPYIKKKNPVDPWGNKYVYVSPGNNNPKFYDLSSWGSDGVEGGGDDITNWGEEQQ